MLNKYIQTIIDKKSHIALVVEAAEKEIPLQHLLWQIIKNHLNQSKEEDHGRGKEEIKTEVN